MRSPAMRSPALRAAVLRLSGVVLLSTLSAAAIAADLPSRRAPPAFLPPPVPLFTWTGAYAGVNVGAAFDQRRQNTYAFSNAGGPNTIVGSEGTDGILSLGNSNNVAFTGGGQIGYNYQFNPGNSVVVGIEADAQYLGSRSANSNNYAFTPTTPLTYGLAFVPVPGLPNPAVRVTGQRTDFFGTVRGRLGYAFDRVFAYGTGGLAYNERGVGYAVGGGLEYALSDHVTVKGEYLYVNLDRTASYSATYDIASNVLTINSGGGRNDFSVARLGLNYKFDLAAPAAVVARY